MSEFDTPLRPEEYQSFVASTFKDVEPDDWQRRYAALTAEELVEALFQHGAAVQLLLPFNMPEDYQIPAEKKEGMFDEIMDLTWFGFAAAERLGISAKEACIVSLYRHTGLDYSYLNTLGELESTVWLMAHNIKFRNSLHETGVDPDDPRCFTAVTKNPFYALARATNRLVSILTDARHAPSPGITTDLERELDQEQVVGDFLNTLFYITRTSFDRHVDEAVIYNAVKLLERSTWGKPESVSE